MVEATRESHMPESFPRKESDWSQSDCEIDYVMN